MGIKNLNSILKKYAPECYNTVHVSEFKYKKIAVDLTLYLYKYKVVFNDSWLYAIFELVTCFRKNDVHCVFVYDNKPPIEKIKEREKRTSKKLKQSEKISDIKSALHRYNTTGEPEQILFDICSSKSNLTSVKRLLRREVKEKIDVNTVEAYIAHLESQNISLTANDMKLVIELFDILNVPCILAPMEAEAFCSDLCTIGKVDAVLSEDTDVLAHSAPIFMSKIDISTGTCNIIEYDFMLSELNFSNEQFLDMCILCGTDYNSSLKGVGPENSYKLIQEFFSINNFPFDTTELNHIRVRELFKFDEQSVKDVNIPYCGKPDKNRLSQFFWENNIGSFNLEQRLSCYSVKIELI
jgi:flap endonuclease-1